MKNLIPALLITALLTGCVAQTEVDNLRSVNRTLEESNLDLKARIAELEAELELLRNSATLSASDEAAYRSRIAKLEEKIAQLEAALATAEAEIARLAADTTLTIDPRVASQLEALAKANPDLMSWDEARGMIRLRSDLTFDLGSTTVKAPAVAALGQLATVLKDPAAAQYEVRIVGHTDNVKVAARTGRRFQNNWELSAFRAISVKDVFEKQGIGLDRMSIAGYGQYQPIVANGSRGAEANRRVEIYLVTRVAPAAAVPAPEAPAAPAAPANAGAVEAMPAPSAPAANPAEFK